ncbi:hypothetical protein GT347_24180 [Xylophilus rhododendri]|uniref:O-methyltransferase C-terminal domain-containing protein n=1 Tax=Xylophilus rhododendri TaxID=2697032 RepID=A0A857JCI1_9BURK|nr:methyltransferase [Xylophilus rhododendri]QHJ00810.1 hypothetical protein GT347_24180 [Xylophilus rhododendri]
MSNHTAKLEKIRQLIPAIAFQEGLCETAPPPVHRSCRPFYFDAPEFGRIDQMLDIGGGPGYVASLLKEEHPPIRITVFDLPPVCDRALDIFRESGQGAELGAHAGDFFHDPFPTGFRAMQFSHVLELFTPDRIGLLLKKSFDALPRNGRLLVYGQASAANEEPPAVQQAPTFPFQALALPAGISVRYSAEQYLYWLRLVGFSTVTCRQDASARIFLAAWK